jgi:hypothetical protein
MLLSVEPTRVASVHLSIPPGTLLAGERVQLLARVIDKHLRSLAYPVRWGVADPDIAGVSTDGVLVARSAGTVEIFAESNGIRSTVRVEIAPTAVAAVHLTFEPERPVIGDPIVATATPIDANRQPLAGRMVTWSVSDPSLVNAISDGVYEAVAKGQLRLTAKSEGKSATVEIPISAPSAAVIHVSPPPGRVFVGSTFSLSAVALDARGSVLANQRIDWSSLNRSVATVSDDGVVTPRAVGETRIIAACEGKSAWVALTVYPAPVASVKITDVPTNVLANTTFRLAATITDVGGARIQKAVAWRSSRPSVAHIDSSGQVTATAAGDTRISAVCDGVGDSVVISVAESVVPTPISPRESQLEVPQEPVAATSFFVPSGPPAMQRAVLSPASARPSPQDAVPRSWSLAPWIVAAAGISAVVITGALLVTRGRNTVDTATVDSSTSAPKQVIQPVKPQPVETTAATRGAQTGQTPPGSQGAAQQQSTRQQTTATKATGKTTGKTPQSTGTASPDTAVPPLISTVTPPQTRIEIPGATVVTTPPVRPETTAKGPPPPSAEEIRAKGADALRRSVDALVSALNAKDANRVTQILGDGQNDNSSEMLKATREYGFAASLSPLKQPTMSDHTGALEYEIKVHWQTPVGGDRDRIATVRAEAGRSGDTWTVPRHRVLSWR